MLSNRLENAVDHGGRRTNTEQLPSVDIHVSAADDNRLTQFELRDSNDSIPNSELEAIRAGDETALKYGLGVGLWVVNWCVTMLDGEIDCSYDNGTVIRVSVPQQ